MSPLIYLTLWKNTHLEIKLTVLKKIRLIKSNSNKSGLWNKFIFADPPIILHWHSQFMTPLPLSSTNEWFALKYFMECLSIFHYLFYIMSNQSLLSSLFQILSCYRCQPSSCRHHSYIYIYNNGGFLDPHSFLSNLSSSLLFIFLV